MKYFFYIYHILFIFSSIFIEEDYSLTCFLLFWFRRQEETHFLSLVWLTLGLFLHAWDEHAAEGSQRTRKIFHICRFGKYSFFLFRYSSSLSFWLSLRPGLELSLLYILTLKHLFSSWLTFCYYHHPKLLFNHFFHSNVFFSLFINVEGCGV